MYYLSASFGYNKVTRPFHGSYQDLSVCNTQTAKRLLTTRLPTTTRPGHKQVKNPPSSPCKQPRLISRPLLPAPLQLPRTPAHCQVQKEYPVVPCRGQYNYLGHVLTEQMELHVQIPTWKCKIMVQMRPRVSLGLPSVMSSLRMFTNFT